MLFNKDLAPLIRPRVMVIHLFCYEHLLVLKSKKMMVGLQMSILSKLWLGKRLDKNFSLAKYDFTRAMGRTNYIMRYGVLGWGCGCLLR